MQRTDLALALAALWLGRCATAWTTLPDLSLCVDWARRADGYRTRAQRFAVGYSHCGEETLPQLATRLAAQLKKMRRINVTMPNKLSVTAGERQVMNAVWSGTQYQGI